jgi:hypothetical protein
VEADAPSDLVFLIGEHNFSSFRAAAKRLIPVRQVYGTSLDRRGVFKWGVVCGWQSFRHLLEARIEGKRFLPRRRTGYFYWRLIRREVGWLPKLKWEFGLQIDS